MPDWCFLDDADPDWDAACEQINESEYQQFDVNLTWDINDRWTFTSITGLSDFESHGIADWVMIGTEKRHNDIESDVVYQELQLNAAFDRFDLVTGSRISRRTSTAARERARRITTGAERAVSTQAANGDGVESAAGQRLVRRGRYRRPTGLAVDRGCSRTSLGTLPTASISLPACATRSTRKSDGDAIPGLRLRACRRLARTDLSRPTTGTTPTGGSRSTTRSPTTTWCMSRRRRLFVPAGTATTSITLAATRRLPRSHRGFVVGFHAAGARANDEIGARTEWLDGRLRVNLTYFDMAYTNRQGPIQIRTRRCRRFPHPARQHRRRGFERLRSRARSRRPRTS